MACHAVVNFNFWTADDSQEKSSESQHGDRTGSNDSCSFFWQIQPYLLLFRFIGFMVNLHIKKMEWEAYGMEYDYHFFSCV